MKIVAVILLTFGMGTRARGDFDRIIVDINKDTLKGRDFYVGGGDAKDSFLCYGLGPCVPIQECGDNYALEAAKKCYNGEKNIFCGVDGQNQPMVCCARTRRDFETCGKSLVQGRDYKGLGAYPFVVRVGFRNILDGRIISDNNNGNTAYPCTGSILSRNTVLTSAHCALAKSDGFKLATIRVGDYDGASDPDCSEYSFCAPVAVNHRISYIIVHPDYIPGEYHHDIALIVLKVPLNYTVAAQPVCLRGDKAELTVGRRTTIAGWGRVAHSSARSNRLEALELPLAPWETCQRVYGPTGALKSTKALGDQLMCVGGEGRDVCQGFGGSPLVIKENGIFWQIAILSFGSDACGEQSIPSVYTGIAHFIDWIHENLPPE